MRKIFGVVAVVLGSFLLVAAALGQFWAPSKAERTPLDVNTTTRLSGSAAKLDATSGQVQNVKVKASSVNKTDSHKSTAHVVSFVETTCLVVDKGNVPDCVAANDPQDRLISATTDVFATDRHTAESVPGKQYTTSKAVPHVGLVNKWPFDAQRKAYQFWDTTLVKAVPAKYAATEAVDGLRTYRYDVNVPTTDAEVLQGVQGKYSTTSSIWIEPRTGAIIKQQQHQVRTQANGDPLLDLHLTYTDATIKAAADDARSSISSLRMVTQVVPIAGLVGGVVLLVLGLFLLLGGRRRGAHVT